MTAYYNEHDHKAAAWLRDLIKAGHIAPGEVDDRSVADVQPADLAGFTQCHFFAGIGVWSYALRLAGWSDDHAVWTGSCPCQSFSASGKREGFSDPRHLWPTWERLIRECRPHVLFGEQVASKDGLAWFDVVSADLEGAGYAVGACDLCAAGVGAPHIRQRLFFVAESDGGLERHGDLQRSGQHGQLTENRGAVCLADPLHAERGTVRLAREDGCDGQNARRQETFGESGACGEVRWMADAEVAKRRRTTDTNDRGWGYEKTGRPGPTNGFWAYADWIACTDGKSRPVEPGTFPLAYGTPGRLVRLRGYGNAINAQAAKAFIEAFKEVKCS